MQGPITAVMLLEEQPFLIIKLTIDKYKNPSAGCRDGRPKLDVASRNFLPAGSPVPRHLLICSARHPENYVFPLLEIAAAIL